MSTEKAPTSAIRIPFNRPPVLGTELGYIAEVLESGHTAGDGAYTKKCHRRLEELTGARRVLLTTSCTHALEMSALLLDLAPGDEVIVPSFAFVTTVSAFVMRGARPTFVDILPDTLCMDPKAVEAAITPRTKAIVPLHYAGVACEMDELLEIARKHGLKVVEDNAHGLFGTYKGRQLGTLGDLGTQSFHETKNFAAGEGGALLINNPAFAERAEVIREKGTNRSRFFRGQVDKYSWVDLGSSYLPSDILAAVLFAQLEKHELIQARRRQLWERYASELSGFAEARGFRLPHVPAHCGQTFHMFYMLTRSLDERQALIAHMREAGIQAPFHYLPLHLSDMGVRWGGKVGDCPVTEDVSDRLVRLPLYYDLSDDAQGEVIARLETFG
jgi:dTDP-4-amino-4,6-dideoxygalactose transaminase